MQNEQNETPDTPGIPDTEAIVETDITPASPMRKRFPWWIMLIPVLLAALGGGGYYGWRQSHQIDTSQLHGRFVCVISTNDSEKPHTIYSMPASGHTLTRVLGGGKLVRALPSRNAVFVLSESQYARESPTGDMWPPKQACFLMSPDGEQMMPVDPIVDRRTSSWPEGNIQDGLPDVDSFGKAMVFAVIHQGAGDIMLQCGTHFLQITRDGNPGKRLKRPDGELTDYRFNSVSNTCPQFSPSGSQILYLKYRSGGVDTPDGGHTPMICITDPYGKEHRELTRGEKPSFSSDSTYLVFERDYSIYRIKVDGTGEQCLAKNAASPSVSPDGKFIAFVESTDKANWLCVMRSDCSDKTRVTRLPDVFNSSSLAWVNDAPHDRWAPKYAEVTPKTFEYDEGIDPREIMVIRAYADRASIIVHGLKRVGVSETTGEHRYLWDVTTGYEDRLRRETQYVLVDPVTLAITGSSEKGPDFDATPGEEIDLRK